MTSNRDFDKKKYYEIRVKGTLDQTWSDWFDGFEISHLQGITMLAGTVTDQAALFGMLAKLVDLNLPLLLVQRKEGIED